MTKSNDSSATKTAGNTQDTTNTPSILNRGNTFHLTKTTMQIGFALAFLAAAGAAVAIAAGVISLPALAFLANPWVIAAIAFYAAVYFVAQTISSYQQMNANLDIANTKGKDGNSPSAQEVANTLKADQSFKNDIKGENGEDGKSPSAQEVANTLKADQSFKNDIKGENGINGKDYQLVGLFKDAAITYSDNRFTLTLSNESYNELKDCNLVMQIPYGNNIKRNVNFTLDQSTVNVLDDKTSVIVTINSHDTKTSLENHLSKQDNIGRDLPVKVCDSSKQIIANNLLGMYVEPVSTGKSRT